MAILAMALLQQHDAHQDILIEPAARRHAAVRNWGHNRAVKTNRLVCLSVTLVYCCQAVVWIKMKHGMKVDSALATFS